MPRGRHTITNFRGCFHQGGAAFYVHQQLEMYGKYFQRTPKRQREDLKVRLPKNMVNDPPDKVFVKYGPF